MKHGVYEDV